MQQRQQQHQQQVYQWHVHVPFTQDDDLRSLIETFGAVVTD
jgi:hypothetical protein